MFSYTETYSYTEVKPLVVKPQLSIKRVSKGETFLDYRRKENIQKIRRQQSKKRKKQQFKIKIDPEFIALTLMGSGLSLMIIKTAVENLFKFIQ